MQTGDASNTYPQAMKDAAKNSAYSELLDTFGPSDETQFPYSAAILSAQIFDGPVCKQADGIGFPTPYSGTWAYNTVPLGLGSYYQHQSVGTYPKMDGTGNLVRDKDNIPLVGGNINGSVSADASGRLWGFYKVYYGYSSNYGSSGSVSPMTPPAGSLMPDHINLLLQTNVMAWAFAGKPAGASGKVTALAIASIPFFGETLVLPADGDSPLDQPKKQIGGRHLVRSAVVPLDAMSGIATVYVDGEVHTQASNGVVYDQWKTMPYGSSGSYTFYNPSSASAGTWSFVTAGVKQDPREVWISSPTIEDSFFKLVTPNSGPPETGTRTQHFRAPNGSIATDSAVLWDHSYKLWRGMAYFTANTPGFANPTYAWSLPNAGGGTPLPYPGTTLFSQMQNVSLDLSFGRDTGGLQSTKPTSLQVDVQDSDGTTASNTFGITWHLPFQETSLIASVYHKDKIEQVLGPIHAGAGLTLQQSDAKDVPIEAGFDAAGAVAGLAGQEEVAGVFEIVGKLCGAADLKYHQGETISQTITNGKDMWTPTMNRPDWAENVDNPDLLNYIDPKTGEYDGWSLCDLSMWSVKMYHHVTWYADKYTSHGYDSSGYVLYANPIDKIEEEPYYRQVSFPPPH